MTADALYGIWRRHTDRVAWLARRGIDGGRVGTDGGRSTDGGHRRTVGGDPHPPDPRHVPAVAARARGGGAVTTLRIIVTRDRFLPDRTLSRVDLVLPGESEPKPFGFALEDVDRHVEDDPKRKVKGKTAIPTGTYRVHLYDSPKHGTDTPELLNVPGFAHIQVHSGVTPDHTEGCILMGLRRTSDHLVDSRKACAWLKARIIDVIEDGGEVWVDVRREA